MGVVTLRIAAGLCALSLLSATAPAAAAPKTSGDGKASVAAAKKIISSRLIDPDSAKFTFLPAKTAKAHDGSATQIVCGSYNAKNRMGGYVGSKSFAYVSSEDAVYTTNLDRLAADGSARSVDDVTAKIKQLRSADGLMALLGESQKLTEEVEFWLYQC